MPSQLHLRAALALAAAALIAAGCRQDMHDQPRLEPLEASAFFDDGAGSRRLPEGTVARGLLREDTGLWEGKNEAGELVDELPMELSRELLEHGRERYEIFCSVCHDSVGSGRGMIVRRGFKQPPPLYEDRLVAMPAGYFYDVITNGFGVMSSYAKQIPVEDRWAIVAYLRVLQTSQNARLDELPPRLQEEFQHQHSMTTAPGDDPHAAGHGEGEEAHH